MINLHGTTKDKDIFNQIFVIDDVIYTVESKHTKSPVYSVILTKINSVEMNDT
jgi:hypothetical protein